MPLIFPWPDKRLTPNAKRRKHWRSYQPAIKNDREIANGMTLALFGREIARARAALTGTHKIPVRIRFVPPDARRRDDDGMIAAFKHMRDGMCDALKLDDFRLQPVYEIAAPEKPGRVEVIFP